MALSYVGKIWVLCCLVASEVCLGCGKGTPNSVLAFVNVGSRPSTDRLYLVGEDGGTSAWTTTLRDIHNIRGLSVSSDRMLLQCDTYAGAERTTRLILFNVEPTSDSGEDIKLDEEWAGIPFLYNSGSNILYLALASGESNVLRLRGIRVGDRKVLLSIDLSLREGGRRRWSKIVAASAAIQSALLITYELTPAGVQTTLLEADLAHGDVRVVGEPSAGIAAATYSPTGDEIAVLTRDGVETAKRDSSSVWTLLGPRIPNLHFRGNRIAWCHRGGRLYVPLFNSVAGRSELWSFDLQTRAWKEIKAVRDGSIDYVSCV